ncbi:hypothetical protein PG2010B_0319 [Bifidobacterium animalis subsp. lactis]|nr:hypothetical protein PG2010B_0319 [Bifidobacterium animalis subsp. lactis]RYM94200.1 hypothetical protein PG2007B_0321 [Bifidobacterium animalis subsp. lactis]RYN07955.1 hypothetical protein PG1528B_0314 [Bifidobacterium animalis subsp. lactis]
MELSISSRVTIAQRLPFFDTRESTFVMSPPDDTSSRFCSALHHLTFVLSCRAISGVT